VARMLAAHRPRNKMEELEMTTTAPETIEREQGKLSDDYAYRFQYADGSAFVIYDDGRAFITFPEKNGRTRPPEQKFGKIDNRIQLLMGRVAKPRQDEIERLLTALRRISSLDEKNVPKYAQQIAIDAINRAEGLGK